MLVEPSSPQMVSGVDALDWNGDGDIDILTGQGHGGTGLRFYRARLRDGLRQQDVPKVTLGACQARPR